MGKRSLHLGCQHVENARSEPLLRSLYEHFGESQVIGKMNKHIPVAWRPVF
jgi:hypothetical protein